MPHSGGVKETRIGNKSGKHIRMAVRYQEIADRLRAFRIDSGLSAEEVAKRVGISRTALYRFEKGELAKIETLEKLSDLLNVSMPTLLGVGVEYMPSAVSYFERVRQFEERAEHIIVLAGPISFLLASDNFLVILEKVLRESLPLDIEDRDVQLKKVDHILDILSRRKAVFKERRPAMLNLISMRDLSRLLQSGMVGNSSIKGAELEERRRLARAEIEHFIGVIEEETIGVQIGIVPDSLPHTGFQIFRMADRKHLTLSPFRLGEQPNVRVGVAMVTSAPDAIKLHEKAVTEMWRGALKGREAVARLREMMREMAPPAEASTGPFVNC